MAWTPLQLQRCTRHSWRSCRNTALPVSIFSWVDMRQESHPSGPLTAQQNLPMQTGRSHIHRSARNWLETHSCALTMCRHLRVLAGAALDPKAAGSSRSKDAGDLQCIALQYQNTSLRARALIFRLQCPCGAVSSGISHVMGHAPLQLRTFNMWSCLLHDNRCRLSNGVLERAYSIDLDLMWS